MQGDHPKRVEDYTAANLILIFVNLLWIFVAVWSAWGLAPVLIIAAVLNHLITRYEYVRNLRDARHRPDLDRA